MMRPQETSFDFFVNSFSKTIDTAATPENPMINMVGIATYPNTVQIVDSNVLIIMCSDYSFLSSLTRLIHSILIEINFSINLQILREYGAKLDIALS